MKLARTVFWFSSLLIVFFLASLMGHYRMITYDLIFKPLEKTLITANQLIKGKPDLVREAKYNRQGVTVYKENQLQGRGLTAIQGWFTDGAQVKLIDYQGNQLNAWPIDFYSIWPDPVHISDPEKLPQTQFNFHSQGMYLYPDGSLLANVQSLGMFKMDRCGDVLWTLDKRTHHTVELDDEGFIWVPVAAPNNEVPEELILDVKETQVTRKSYFGYDHSILKLSAEGKLLQEISLLKSIFDAGIEDRLYDSLYINYKGFLHPNDIEIVTESLADKIKGVKKGDLLLSLRQMHMLTIVDRETGELLWYQIGPWVRQHDPDIDKHGNISIYNNRSSKLVYAEEEPYSNILKYDPRNNHVEVLYPQDEAQENQFYSDIMGSHQLLANGHVLITETRTGRVFEANTAGDIVWEYIEAYKEDYAALIESAERYPDDYFDDINWNDCPVKSH